jgi:hypothetical protein
VKRGTYKQKEDRIPRDAAFVKAAVGMRSVGVAGGAAGGELALLGRQPSTPLDLLGVPRPEPHLIAVLRLGAVADAEIALVVRAGLEAVAPVTVIVAVLVLLHPERLDLGPDTVEDGDLRRGEQVEELEPPRLREELAIPLEGLDGAARVELAERLADLLQLSRFLGVLVLVVPEPVGTDRLEVRLVLVLVLVVVVRRIEGLLETLEPVRRTFQVLVPFEAQGIGPLLEFEVVPIEVPLQFAIVECHLRPPLTPTRGAVWLRKRPFLGKIHPKELIIKSQKPDFVK